MSESTPRRGVPGGRPTRLAVAIGLVAAVALTVPAAAEESTAPGPPVDLRLQTVEYTWFTAAWDAPADDPDAWVLYRAKLTKADDPGYRQGPYSVFGTSTSFGGLQQGTTYTMSVWTVDRATWEESPPVSIEVTTPVFGDPPEAPTNLRAIHADGVLQRVEWHPSANNPDVWYWVYFGALDPGNAFVITSRTWFPVSDVTGGYPLVEPGSTHTLTIRARDAGGGWSPPSEPLTVTFP